MSKSETRGQEDTDQESNEDQFPSSQTSTCPNGLIRCNGPDSDTLPCFACFDPTREYNEEAAE
jgi:hypothetical protein